MCLAAQQPLSTCRDFTESAEHLSQSSSVELHGNHIDWSYLFGEGTAGSDTL
jgi:hypothetical protein